LQRHEVFHSDRIRVTEQLIRETGASRVLEVGAGDYSFDYLKQPGSSWLKADNSPPCDVVCDFNASDATLPFPSAQFDLVICTEVIEHLLWPQQLLGEIARVLLPQGSLLISVPNIASLSYRAAWLLGHLPSCAASANLPPELDSTTYRLADGRLVGGHVIDFNRGRLLRLLGHCGFVAENCRGSGIIWHRQILPYWMVPSALASNLICIARKKS
jgi:SAM-dependent methyltransferase